MKNRQEIIKEYCRLAEFYCLNPWDFRNFKQQSKIYNISKNDFVKIKVDNICGAMILDVCKWKPKYEISKKEYKEILNKEQHKNKLWKTLINIKNKTFKNEIMEKIESFEINSWDELKNRLGEV